MALPSSATGAFFLRADWLRGFAMVLLSVAGVSMLLAAAVERGNNPYTLNFVTPGDWAIGGAFLSVPVVGAMLLSVDPWHRTGWLMVASGLALSVGLFCHAIAVRLLVASPHAGSAGEVADWFATWLLVPGFGLLAFVAATWPVGHYHSRWSRRFGAVAATGLGIATVLQAFAPDHLDGVDPTVAPANPIGVPGLATIADPVTFSAAVILLALAVATVLSAVLRSVVRHRNRRGLATLIAGALLVPATIAAATRVLGDQDAAGVVVAVGGLALAVFVVVSGLRRVQRAERARAAIVAEREDERRRIRQDLHDGVGPMLAALALELDVVAEGAPTERARELLSGAIDEVRRISRDLRPAALDELGLVGALGHQARLLSVPGGPRIDVDVVEPIPELTTALQVAILRIGGEALTNSIRHAHPTTCRLRLFVDNAVHLVVIDDGIGLEGAVDGVGLTSMRARAEELGGRCEVWPGDNGGTRVEAVLPFQEARS